ncbi:unnamed protein product, partial [Clonostachys solani]
RGKFLHKEAQEILYGENKFVIRSHHKQAGDLDILNHLSLDALSAMRCLMVRLNSWPCIRGHSDANLDEDCNECKICSFPVPLSDPEISTANSDFKSIIQTWTTICQRLSTGVSPGRLHLEFIADVRDLPTAKRLAEPLGSLPRLQGCIVRFGRKPNHTLSSLARSIASRLTHKTEEAATSGRTGRSAFIYILKHTNIGPWGSFLPELDAIHVMNKTFDQRYTLAGKGSIIPVRRCCHYCSFTKLHCSCPLNYAAYSPQCQCRVLPLELFLVSRQMRLDASEVFYGANVFRFRGPLYTANA